MSDVFISYAREDEAFVRRLFDALEADDRDTWVDWKDIPPAAEWMEEIYSAIEGADNFVFVISPNSLTSEVCNKELAHAIKHNKQRVPVVRRKVDETAIFESLEGQDWEDQAMANWEALEKINWLFFRESDDFESAFQKLLEAITVDLDWTREHTRLLVRAVEWDRKGRDGSFLLRGDELEKAEQWLAQGAVKEPRPTSLHTDYVIASRRAATRRQRVMLGATSFGLVVAITLALLAWWQRKIARDAQATAITEAKVRATAQVEAEHSRSTAVAEAEVRATAQARAENQARIAKARALVAQAQTALALQRPQESLLLAAEALRSNLARRAAKQAMLDALAQTRGRGWGICDGPVTDIAVSSDGRWLVTESGQYLHPRRGNFQVLLWDLTTSKPTRPIALEEYWMLSALSLVRMGIGWPLVPSMGVFSNYSIFTFR
jgi:hypothetical protein